MLYHLLTLVEHKSKESKGEESENEERESVDDEWVWATRKETL